MSRAENSHDQKEALIREIELRMISFIAIAGAMKLKDVEHKNEKSMKSINIFFNSDDDYEEDPDLTYEIPYYLGASEEEQKTCEKFILEGCALNNSQRINSLNLVQLENLSFSILSVFEDQITEDDFTDIFPDHNFQDLKEAIKSAKFVATTQKGLISNNDGLKLDVRFIQALNEILEETLFTAANHDVLRVKYQGDDSYSFPKKISSDVAPEKSSPLASRVKSDNRKI